MTEANITPLAVWDSQDPRAEGLVWWTRIDKRYQIEVHRVPFIDELSAYHGTLHIFDHGDGDRLLHSEHVPLAYGAIVGPDQDDVLDWQNTCLKLIDAMNEEKS